MRYGLDNSQIQKEPLLCHWCGNNLKGIRNVYKGKDCERWYCSEEHHKKGEEQAALRARAALRRGWDVVSSHYLVSASILVMLMLAFIVSGGHKAWAQETIQAHPGHEKYHVDFYSKWQRPDYLGSSCCDEKVWHDNNGYRYSTGHCYPAPDSKLINGVWWVELDNQIWVKVPEKRILHREASPNPAVAHVCEHYADDPKDPIYCFREPVGGS